MTGGERFPRPFLWANAKDSIRIAGRWLPRGSCGFGRGGALSGAALIAAEKIRM